MKLKLVLLLVGVAGLTAQGMEVARKKRFAITTPPCQMERENALPDDIELPDCDAFGFHRPKQCSADGTTCWCVTRCGDPILETKGGSDIVCEPDDPPCTKELEAISGRPRLIGMFKPTCNLGFYSHTQCRGSVCWCTDRCGYEVESSKHAIGMYGVCECPDDAYAWKCDINPCDRPSAVCQAHPDAICKPSICGGCHAKFYIDENEVDCEAEAVPFLEPILQCRDNYGNLHNDGESWKEDKCLSCTCFSGRNACLTPMCQGSWPVPMEYCSVKEGMEDVCCPKFDCEFCLDDMGMYHSLGEEWRDLKDNCSSCSCVSSGQISCTRACPSVHVGPLCEYLLLPGECCLGETVCHDPITDCPPGSGVTTECASDICLNAVCAGHPDATCVVSHCGVCHTVFYDNNGTRLECENEPISREPSCLPPGRTCIISPCDTSTDCTYYPEAECFTDYCDPCSPLFFNEVNQQLDCDTPPPVCEDSSNNTHNVGETWTEGCNECVCEDNGVPSCKTSKCEVDQASLSPLCELVYGEGDECCPSRVVCHEALSNCPETYVLAHFCPGDLCVNAVCEGHPSATCRISHCGGCSAKFFDENDEVIDECSGELIESSRVCVDTGPVFTCVSPPCHRGMTCAADPEAVCHADYCQPCNPLFHDKENKLLNCLLAPEVCTDSANNEHKVGETWTEGCNECVCQDSGFPSCKTSKCEVDQASLSPLCELVYGEGDECCPSRVVCHEALSNCPETYVVAQSCPDDLCVNAVCEGHPSATCRISHCGGCSVKFFDKNDEVIDECSGELIEISRVCVDTGPVLTCFVPPCLSGTTCSADPEAACHADYCQPCDPLFHDKENNLLECFPVPEPEPQADCDPTLYDVSPRGNPTLQRCLKDYSFSPKQCDVTGHCWCVKPDGSPTSHQPDMPPGKDLFCESDPTCLAELKSNSLKAQRGDPVTSDPVCTSVGWYVTVQCCPISGNCWCSERDGTMLVGSMKPSGEPLNCNSPCFGNEDLIVPFKSCSRQGSSCPSDAACHIPPNRTSGRCCRFPGISVMP